jgi:ABC-2 type transport system ATP-binding protein
MADFIDDASVETVRVRASRIGQLARLVEESGAKVTMNGEVLTAEGVSSDHIGTLAAQAQITVLELSPQSASLEDAYLALTRDSVDFRADDHDGPAVHALADDEGAA